MLYALCDFEKVGQSFQIHHEMVRKLYARGLSSGQDGKPSILYAFLSAKVLVWKVFLLKVRNWIGGQNGLETGYG